MVREKIVPTLPGGLMLPVLVALFLTSLFRLIWVLRAGWEPAGWAWLVLLLVSGGSLAGLFVVNPNEAKVVQLFGTYLGSARRPGFHWTNPLTLRRGVSLRVRNFESAKIKVNDLSGNPMEIAAVVVWRVVVSAEAIFEVDDYQNFVHVQSEAAVRNLAMSYPYDAHVEGEMALEALSSKHVIQLDERRPW